MDENKLVHWEQGMARAQDVDGGDDLQLWKVAADAPDRACLA
jgi:hypothetical protein